MWDISWGAYTALLKDHEQKSAPRFTYDRGTLEIVRPSYQACVTDRVLCRVVELATEELRGDLIGLGSSTFQRSDLQMGFESDGSFWFGDHAELIRGHDDPNPIVHPPPDLVIEVDRSTSWLDKLPIYAAFGVPEVWISESGQVAVNKLSGDCYERIGASLALPVVTAELLTHALEQHWQLGFIDWTTTVRGWLQKRSESS